ncbi:FtsH/Yme1/Tma family ATP-dependent metallopeptidase [Phaeocystidibacter luteus]|nr:hypothetical protein [Phaeocystidibacter luteus]
MEQKFTLPSKSDKEYQEKLGRLNNAQLRLKSEFIGIDIQIDQVIDAIRTWYLFPGVQERPTVINLWGMTGVGKTDLITKLIEYLGLTEMSETIDCTDNSMVDLRFEEVLTDFIAKKNDSRAVVVMDEFQHLKSRGRKGIEILDNSSFWQVLDRGKFIKSIRWSDIYDLKYTLENLKRVKIMIDRSTKLSYRAGKVIGIDEIRGDKFVESYFQGQSAFNRLSEADFIAPGTRSRVETILETRLPHKELEELFYDVTMDESLAILERAIQEGKRPKTIDCPDVLIITLGNLDGAYSITGSDSTDVDADALHDRTSKITFNQIHNALLYRFRPEHIARLGNQHIIYPTLSRKAFEGLIQLYLDRFKKQLETEYFQGVEVNIDKSLADLIYTEGVAPAMGVRNVKNTFERIVDRQLGGLIELSVDKGFSYSKLSFDVEENFLHIEWESTTRECGQLIKKLHLPIYEARKRVTNDQRALHSVHEAGHAIASYFELNEVPLQMSATSYDGNGAFVMFKPNDRILNYRRIMARGVMLAAGLVAEEMFFGSEERSAGSQSDLLNLTSLVRCAVTDYGMGKELYPVFMIEPDVIDRVEDPNHEVGEQIKRIMNRCKRQAYELLKRETSLLRILAHKLYVQGTLSEKEIHRIITENISSPIVEESESQGYADKLQLSLQMNGEWKLAALD